MPVAWEFRDQLLAVMLIGDYDFHAPKRAVLEAIADPAFKPGTMLLVDARLSTARRSSDDFRERAVWMASLKERGFAERFALVINSQTHQFGMARMAAAHVEMRGLQLGIFSDLESASQWLLGRASSKGVERPGEIGEQTRTSGA